MQQYDDKFADMRRYKSDDLIERLRSDGQQTQRDCEQAADEIEHLTAENEELIAAADKVIEAISDLALVMARKYAAAQIRQDDE